MNDKEKKLLIIAGGIAALLFLFHKPAGQADNAVIATPDASPVGAATPAGTPALKPQAWIPGEYSYDLIFGGNPIINVGGSEFTIDTNNLLVGSLGRQYIPMFGFVGVQGVGNL